ncbi:uncharacterized protein LOC106670191 [Cimex lectularius]|uniref:RIIa domain-containing protein n=1 Tax=Cimex lectularius TaxID=79782 RepID=A0A8I6TGH1_CIMLE|nr:uncharacterized protein LOC106670191 [Cimex lectularius]
MEKINEDSSLSNIKQSWPNDASNSLLSKEDSQWEQIFKHKRSAKKSIKNPLFLKELFAKEEESPVSSTSIVEEPETVDIDNRIEDIVANIRKKSKRKKKPPAPICPPAPPQSLAPDEVEPQPETEEAEILFNLRAFYLNQADLDRMPRREKMFVFDPVEKKMVGKMTISTEFSEDKVFLSVEGIKTDEANELRDVYFHFAWLTNDFVPLKEFRTEQAWAPGEEYFRSLHIMRLGDAGLNVSAKRGSNGDEINESYFAKMKSLKRVLSEAGIFILMRKMVYSYYVGTLKMKCIFTTGDICPTNIRCFPSKRMVLNNVALYVVRIRRKVLCPNGKEEVTNTFFTTAGQYIAQVYKNERYRIQIDPFASLDADAIVSPERIVPLRCRYEDDPQVNSFYMDEVDRWSYKDRLYLEDHPEVMNIISQLMKEFLLNKPHRVVAFAQNYFTRLL